MNPKRKHPKGGPRKDTRKKPGGKGSNFKDEEHLTDTGAESRYDRSRNDPSWYAANPELLKAYASLPYGVAVGSPLPYLINPNGVNQDTVPGIMGLYFTPTVGYSAAENDPINIAMRKVFGTIRSGNAGATNYEAPDLMIYLLCMDSVFMYHAYLKRVYGCMQAFSQTNRYYARELVRSMGIDYDDMMNNLPNLRAYINLLAAKASSLCIPSGMSYMARHSWMTSNIFVDSSSIKAQTYLFTPADYFMYTYNDTSKVYEATTVHFIQPSMYCKTRFLLNTNDGLKKYSDIVSFGNNLLNPLVASQDINVMSGDILKYYGQQGTVNLQAIPDGYLVLPVYQPEVQSQLENCTIFNAPQSVTVTQATDIGTGYLVSTPTINVGYGADKWVINDITKTTIPGTVGNVLGAPRVLNFHHDNPTPDDVIVATRLQNVVKVASTAGDVITLNDNTPYPVIQLKGVREYGSEILCGAAVFNFFIQRTTSTSTTQLQKTTFGTVNLAGLLSDSSSDAIVRESQIAVARLSSFDWAPQTFWGTANYNVTSGTLNITNATVCDLPVLDFDVYTLVESTNSFNMHTAAILSEFWT